MEIKASPERESAISFITNVIMRLPADKRKLAINEIHKISQESNQSCMAKNTCHTPS